jgi:DnaK suppressor protein
VAKSKASKPAKPKSKAKPRSKPAKPKGKAPAKAKGKVKAGKKHRPPPPLKAVKEALVPVLPTEPRPAATKPAHSGTAKPSIRESEIEEIRQMLVQRREELLAELRTDAKTASPPEKPRSADPTDQASDAADGALSMALAQTESDELAQIETALARIESGDFGICEECGQSIPAERLKVLPYAVTCIDCKRGLEQSRREEGLEDAWEALDESEEEAPEEES